MTGRIVLFLGERTKAKLARYAKWDQANQASACETLFPWSVLMADAEGASKAGSIQVVAICSASTYGDWEYGVADDACDAGYTDRDRIPIGLFQYDDNALGPDSFWGLFDMLRLATGGDTLSEQPGFGVERKSPKDAFSTPADHVVVDITHGFRSVPFLGASALAFAQAANRRRGRSVTHRIYYAAKDAGQNEVIPVWDLTPFVEGVELGDALDAFSRHGRSDDLASFFKSSQVQAARDIAQPMKQFADDLLLMRIPNLLTSSATGLRDTLATRIEDIKNAYPPLRDDLDGLAEQIGRLVPRGVEATPISEAGVQAAAVLARRLWETGRFAELYNLLRESFITAFSIVAVAGTPLQPGNPAFNKQRRKIEYKCNSVISLQPYKPDAVVCFLDTLPMLARDIAKRYSEVQQNRNDVAHCSMRSELQDQEKLRIALEESLEVFEALARELAGG